MRGRIRTLDEIKNAIDAVTLDQVNAYLKKNEPGPFTIVTVGPKELKTTMNHEAHRRSLTKPLVSSCFVVTA